MTIAIRLVPLATAGGRPKKINTGKVMSEPPPARVLITPAKKPTPTSKRISISVSMG